MKGEVTKVAGFLYLSYVQEKRVRAGFKPTLEVIKSSIIIEVRSTE